MLVNAKTPKRFQWELKREEGQPKVIRKSAGRDSQKHSTRITQSEPDSTRFVEEWTGEVGIIADPETRIKEWSTDAVYPILIDLQVQESIGFNTDDVWSQVGDTSAFVTDEYLLIGSTISNTQNAGLRYRTLPIPANATVTSAIIAAEINDIPYAPDPEIVIYGDNVDDAALWSSGNLPKDITKTTNYLETSITEGSGPWTFEVTA